MNSNRFKRNLSALILTAMVLSVAGHLQVAGALVPVNLQCEYRSNPLGIGQVQPQLSWQVQSAERDQRQTAYQILVASTEEIMQKERGDLWDSDRFAGDDSVGIVYSILQGL